MHHSTSSIESSIIEYSDNEDIRRKNMENLKCEVIIKAIEILACERFLIYSMNTICKTLHELIQYKIN